METATQDPMCVACGKPTDGYKCDQCGSESKDHDPNHSHPNFTCSGDNCVPKCSGCNEAQTKCSC